MFDHVLTSRRLFALFTSSIVAVTISASAAFGQTTAFTYQGRLTDGSNPANGAFDMEFKLFDLATVGNQQGPTVTSLNVVVSAGTFSVQLDFGVCTLCFPGAKRYLEISLKPAGDPAYTTLSPRQQILSAPYSLKSANATAADSLSSFCINCVTSSQIASVNGNAVTGPIPASSVPAGSENYIQNTTTQQASSNFNITGNGVLGGTLGIGISNPSRKLEVGGSILIYPSSGNGSLVVRNRSSANFVQVVFNDDADVYRGYLGYIGATGGLGARNDTVEFGTNGKDLTFRPNETEVMRLTSSAKVGIGTNSPDRNVTVERIGGAYINLRDSSFVGGPHEVLLGADSNGGILSTMTNDDLQLRAGGNATKLLIKADGKVGIGTTAPNAKLNVEAAEAFGIFGHNTANNSIGVFGQSLGLDSTGVLGRYDGPASNSGWGVFGFSPNGYAGVFGSGNKNGVFGQTSSSNDSGVFGKNDGNGKGVFGFSNFGSGVYGVGVSGVVGESSVANGPGVLGFTTNPNGYGGVFENRAGGTSLAVIGNAGITGSLSANGSLNANGSVFIGTLPNDGEISLCLNFSGRVSTCGSSARFKSDILPLNAGLDLINRLRPVTFKWQASGRADLGLIAEEVAHIEPLLVTRNAKGDIEGVKYSQLSVVFINAFKEQQAQIERHQEQIRELQHQASVRQEEITLHRKQLDTEQRRNSQHQAQLAKQQAEIDALKNPVCAGHPRAAACKAMRRVR